jgi:hypothetical protein
MAVAPRAARSSNSKPEREILLKCASGATLRSLACRDGRNPGWRYV